MDVRGAVGKQRGDDLLHGNADAVIVVDAVLMIGAPVVATSLLRRRIVEDFEPDMGLKLRRVSGQSGLVLAYRAIGKLRTVWRGASNRLSGHADRG